MRILVLKSKSVCYDSTYYFADCMAQALDSLGHEPVIFDFQGKSLVQIEELAGQSFDAVIDFNSKLPQALDDETDEYYLDRFNAPFFNYILDHPLYHHRNLKEELKDYHVICLDENHADYIRTYYPWIKDVSVLPIGAMPIDAHNSEYNIDYKYICDKKDAEYSEDIKWTNDINGINSNTETGKSYFDRKYDILFTGTYTSPDEVMELIDQCEPEYRKDILELIKIMKEDLAMPMERVFGQVLEERQIVLSPAMFAEYMHLYFLVDTYMTAYVRDMVIRALVEGGIVIDIVGHGWESFVSDRPENIRLHGECSFKDTFMFMNDAKILLNIMPWFKCGAHDRVFSAMRNGAVCLSDESEYLNRYFVDGEDIVTFSLNDMCGFVDKTKAIIHDCGKLEKIAENGRLRVEQGFTWKDRADAIIRIIEDLKG